MRGIAASDHGGHGAGADRVCELRLGDPGSGCEVPEGERV